MKKNSLILCIIAILLTGGVVSAVLLTNATDGEYATEAESIEDVVGTDVVEDAVDLVALAIARYRRERFFRQWRGFSIEGADSQRTIHPIVFPFFFPCFENFDILDYGGPLSWASSDIVVGPIEDEEMAKEKAEGGLGRRVW